MAVGFEAVRLSHNLIWPSSWAERRRESVESTLVTTESLVRKVSVIAILVTLVIVMRCCPEPVTIS